MFVLNIEFLMYDIKKDCSGACIDLLCDVTIVVIVRQSGIHNVEHHSKRRPTSKRQADMYVTTFYRELYLPQMSLFLIPPCTFLLLRSFTYLKSLLH